MYTELIKVSRRALWLACLFGLLLFLVTHSPCMLALPLFLVTQPLPGYP